MFKKSLALTLIHSLMPQLNAPVAANNMHDSSPSQYTKGGKGQLRAAKGKPSGAARLKRAATKRRNIAKH